ncbi:MAG TPA: xanthine dehydrogenase family protein subunit M [Candidatus Binatia bacterium]|nr:xanthine dehydrogenase family protein subunit M [Candidatus Binatia bacterium]
MIPASFDYLAPKSLDEALSVLGARGEDAKLIAGGHSLLPLMKLRLANPKVLIDIGRIRNLNEIRAAKDHMVVGALATHFQIESSALLQKNCPLLPQTARTIGDVQVRNRGTIGGSVVHADPAADWPAAILALGGRLRLRGRTGERMIDAEKFFLGPMTTAIEASEILTEIHLPMAPRRSGYSYGKIAQQASGFAIVGVAVSLCLDAKGRCEDVGIGITGLSDTPFRARKAEERLRGNKITTKLVDACAAEVAAGIDPLDDLHAAADYRAHLARVYTARAVQEAAKHAR